MIDYAPTLAAHAEWLVDPAFGQRANLSDANLNDADLSGADLSDADLRRADLRDANLRDASLRDADLNGARGIPIVADSAERLVAAATAALAEPDALEMESWHTCDTVHCIGGWAIHQAGPIGAVLEQAFGAPIAALLLLGLDAQSHFWDDNENARVYLQSVLDAAQL
jgi:uncharacterized protein YjbI with pentapeptide repeats